MEFIIFNDKVDISDKFDKFDKKDKKKKVGDSDVIGCATVQIIGLANNENISIV